MVRPNGLVGTADGKTLYIADWGAANVFRYTISTNGTLTSKTLFAQVKCDGMTLDAEGNLYFCESAVLVYNAAGQKTEQINVPARPTNVKFGGSDRRTLFTTTDSGSLYSIRMRVRGVAPASTNTGLRSAVWTNGLMQFAITGSLGQSYSVLASTNLADWTTVLTTNLSNTFSYWADRESPGYSRRFYRVLSGP